MDVEVPQVKNLERYQKRAKARHNFRFGEKFIDTMIHFFQDFGSEIFRIIGGIIALAFAVFIILNFGIYILVLTSIIGLVFLIHAIAN